MNKITKINWRILIAIFLFAVGIVYVYDPIATDSGWPSGLSNRFSNTGLFRINSGTILSSLDKENIDVFLPDPRLLDERVNGTTLFNEPILWTQSDHWKIANALTEFVWKDTLDDWKLFSMTFDTDCQNNFTGLPGSVFIYFKPMFDKGRIAFTWREIEIDAEYSYVAWGGDAKFARPILGLKSIDLNRLNITAEDAIKIAEENGGREARLSAQNQCGIHLLLMPERFNGWVVRYQSTNFEILIDPSTGKVIQ